MREIKFRVWDGEEMRVLHKEYLGDYFYGIGYEVGITAPPRPPWVWMQYTGLKDADGQMIYEGDVVELQPGTAHQFTGTVQFGEHLVDSDCYYGGQYWAYGFYVGKGEEERALGISECKVLGNIYEHPELIEQA